VSIASFDSTFWTRALWVSTSGVAPDTVIDSSTAPTFISPLTVAVNPVVSWMPSRFTVPNPLNDIVTAYVPGRRSMILYWPRSSVVTVRTFSISAGLDASTVTPGSTAPVASWTSPAIEPVPVCWAIAGADSNTQITNISIGREIDRIVRSSFAVRVLEVSSRVDLPPGRGSFRGSLFLVAGAGEHIVQRVIAFVTGVLENLRVIACQFPHGHHHGPRPCER